METQRTLPGILKNGPWHDEIYTTRKGDHFYKFKLNRPITKPITFAECTWKTNIPSPSIPDKPLAVVEQLEAEINDLRYKLLVLSLFNVSLVISQIGI